jgi:hypothetical protein
MGAVLKGGTRRVDGRRRTANQQYKRKQKRQKARIYLHNGISIGVFISIPNFLLDCKRLAKYRSFLSFPLAKH